MIVLTALVLVSGLFTFTLGVHYGKRVESHRPAPVLEKEASKVGTISDLTPNSFELAEQSKGEGQVLEETLNQELKKEVTQEGLHLSTPRQVVLPGKPKNHLGGETTLKETGSRHLSKEKELPSLHPSDDDDKSEESRVDVDHAGSHPQQLNNAPDFSTLENGPSRTLTPSKRYTLQIGSYPTIVDAKKQIAKLNLVNLKPFWHEAKIKGKGKRYRLYVGKFSSKSSAEQAGKKYRSRHLISSFMVSQTTE